jgi:hypothetical protein
MWARGVRSFENEVTVRFSVCKVTYNPSVTIGGLESVVSMECKQGKMPFFRNHTD